MRVPTSASLVFQPIAVPFAFLSCHLNDAALHLQMENASWAELIPVRPSNIFCKLTKLRPRDCASARNRILDFLPRKRERRGEKLPRKKSSGNQHHVRITTHPTRSMVYKKHREIETSPSLTMSFLFSYSKIGQKWLVVSYKGVSYKPYCVYPITPDTPEH